MPYVVIYRTEEEKDEILAAVKKNNDEGETIALLFDTGLSTRPAFDTTDHTPPLPMGSLSFSGGSFRLLDKELMGMGFVTMNLW